MNTKEKMYQQIQQHGENLNRIFNTQFDAVTLCKKLHRLEVKAHRLATDYCNGENGIDNIEAFEQAEKPIMESVYKLLNNGKFNDDRPHQKKVPIYLNGDARGYALKINDAYVKLLREQNKNIYTDWGGYGILAPEFDGK